jgi:TusA-related sulfurtransferase
MADVLDLRGFSCPIPLLETKKALTNTTDLTVIVDEVPAKENILKFASSQGYEVKCMAAGGEYRIAIHR